MIAAKIILVETFAWTWAFGSQICNGTVGTLFAIPNAISIQTMFKVLLFRLWVKTKLRLLKFVVPNIANIQTILTNRQRLPRKV